MNTNIPNEKEKDCAFILHQMKDCANPYCKLVKIAEYEFCLKINKETDRNSDSIIDTYTYT